MSTNYRRCLVVTEFEDVGKMAPVIAPDADMVRYAPI